MSDETAWIIEKIIQLFERKREHFRRKDSQRDNVPIVIEYHNVIPKPFPSHDCHRMGDIEIDLSRKFIIFREKDGNTHKISITQQQIELLLPEFKSLLGLTEEEKTESAKIYAREFLRKVLS